MSISIPPRLLDIHQMKYDWGKKNILQTARLSLVPGCIALVGANGAGKTTLLRLLQGLIKPTHGHIQWHTRSTPPHISLVFAQSWLLRRSVRENLRYALDCNPHCRHLLSVEKEQRIETILEQLQLIALQDRSGHRLSSGERQRVALARAAVLQPECLLLDEPTAHLDPESAYHVKRIMEYWRSQGVSLILATHQLSLVRVLADQLVFLHDREIDPAIPVTDFFQHPSKAALQYLQYQSVSE